MPSVEAIAVASFRLQPSRYVAVGFPHIPLGVADEPADNQSDYCHLRYGFTDQAGFSLHVTMQGDSFRVEPLSEILSSGASPGAVNVWSIPLSPSPLTGSGGPVARYTDQDPGKS